MIPRHVVIIMDGNRRWARAKGLPVVMGHKKVVEERIEELIDHAGHLGIEYITFWAFSTENWGRPTDEVSGIMQLFRWALEKKAKKLIEKGARLNWIGDLSKFSDDIRTGFEKMAKASKKNTGIVATFALNYGGRDEIIRGVCKLFHQIQDSRFKIQDLAEHNFDDFLDTVGMPDPDLIIRTSGEQRLSGFMPWQAVYSELYFTDTLMPDFGVKEFDLALKEFSSRQRRHGK